MTKILIVEDNELNRDMLSRRLIRKGFEVLIAVDGGEGVAMATTQLPDLVLMDLSLPVIDGWEATKRLKADPATRHIPIIALTAHAMSGDREKCLAVGCDDFDTKPVDLNRLLEKMETQLQQRAQQVESQPMEPPPAIPATRTTLSGSPRVLVVDDIAANRDVLARRLEKMGCIVELAENGREALELLERTPCDLVLLDINMPQMDGYECLSRVKSDTALRHIPVLMVTALDDLDSVARCIESGADDYLVKPFNPTLLKARVSACLEKKRIGDHDREFSRGLKNATERYGTLLHTIFPGAVAEELMATGSVKPRRYDNVAVLFADIVGFTAYCETRDPEDTLQHLHELFSNFEKAAETQGLNKIKTVGDCFMATSGLFGRVNNPVMAAVRCGLEMVKIAPTLSPGWNVRIGIHVGPVVAGIAGTRQYGFDVWGDTVNTAARIESNGAPASVNISGSAWRHVEHNCRGRSLGMVPVKGKGTLEIVVISSADAEPQVI